MIKIAKLFQTYIWLIDTIRRTHGITLEEINAQWMRTQLSEGVPLHRNSFKRYREAIEDTFHLKIECRKQGDQYRYSLSQSRDLHGNQLKHWLLSSMTVAGIVGESKHLQQRILREYVPSGDAFLAEVTRAMERNCSLEVEYRKFTDAQPYIVEVEPYCLKLFRQRWYLLARRVEDGVMRIFSLDRMQYARSTDHSFSLPPGFNAARYFQHDFGIFHQDDVPTLVTIRAYKGLGQYYATLPLHHSQRLVASTDSYDEFTFSLHPTPDFIQELLSQADRIEVVSPHSLRQAFHAILSEASFRNR